VAKTGITITFKLGSPLSFSLCGSQAYRYSLFSAHNCYILHTFVGV